MNIIIMGPAASGKGTYSSLIKNEYQIPHISTGDLFRTLSSKDNPLAKEIKSYIDNGNLVPDKMTIKLVIDRLGEADCQKGFILDGFPRNLNQAKELDKELSKLGVKIDHVILLDVSYDLISKRFTGRRTCVNCKKVYNIYTMPSSKGDICEECGGELYQRDDDNIASFNVRYNTYLEQTSDAIKYYREKNILSNINGEGSWQEVFPRIKKVLEGE